MVGRQSALLVEEGHNASTVVVRVGAGTAGGLKCAIMAAAGTSAGARFFSAGTCAFFTVLLQSRSIHSFMRDCIQVRRIFLRKAGEGVLWLALEAAAECDSRRIGEVPPQEDLHGHFRRDGVRGGEPFEERHGGADTGVAAEWTLSNKTKNRLAHAYHGNGTVEERIEKVEGEIEEVKGKIQKVEKNLLAIDENEERTRSAHGALYYKLSEEQLRKKEEQLRDDLKQLRKKENLLLAEKQQQASSSSGQ
uniref:Uncharacterized protein n=1 Tax=Chromera velia CCMP2878 TaxID=1169474 RepID=A0A0G4F4B9_9ALVE|eukprot:Cvel_15157.t1-p1 / transcript=Cvel_15157.t1 / gene=Cvel_15157 / organism=Chromera_velia_CCMP2878 / gene_product=hypothetical protein / transcript_product=hypothetical protein / location=Cvel_scaffold1106:54881-56082(+) / protein_length=248 / sequence_SO=supercontig / SO=protein_coding / is_pseudo=false